MAKTYVNSLRQIKLFLRHVDGGFLLPILSERKMSYVVITSLHVCYNYYAVFCYLDKKIKLTVFADINCPRTHL